MDELLSYTVQKPRHAARRYFVHNNHLYTPMVVTDSTGTVVERYSYTAYGERSIVGSSSKVSAVGNGRGFTGYRLDEETGFYYARARMYSSAQGRFISRDPKGFVDGESFYRGYFIPYGLDPSGESFAVSKLMVSIERIRDHAQNRSYFASTTYGYISEGGQDIIGEEYKNGRYCAWIVMARSLNVSLEVRLPTDIVGVEITQNGLSEIEEHENKRVMGWARAYNEYLHQSQDAGANVTRCGMICNCLPGQAKRLLNNYLEQLRDNARKEYWKYALLQQEGIDRENDHWAKDATLYDRFLYHFTVAMPPPFVPPKCPLTE